MKGKNQMTLLNEVLLQLQQQELALRGLTEFYSGNRDWENEDRTEYNRRGIVSAIETVNRALLAADQQEEDSSDIVDNEVLNGPWTEFYPNGLLCCRGSYIDGEPDGPWEEYYSNGLLAYKGSYNNGVKHGPWIEFFRSGKVKYCGFYDCGQQVDHDPDSITTDVLVNLYAVDNL